MRAEVMIGGQWVELGEVVHIPGASSIFGREHGEVYIPTNIAPFECTGRITSDAGRFREGLRRAAENGMRALIADLVNEHGQYGLGHA